jgi:hypothetical protein
MGSQGTFLNRPCKNRSAADLDEVKTALPILLLVAMVLTSCTTLISDEFPDYEKEPVLNSIIIAGRPLEAHLSFAEKIDSTRLPGNGDAAVYFRSDEAGMQAMTGNDSGLYSTGYIPGPGEIVELNATVDGFGEISAVDTIPAAVPVAITDHTHRARYTEDGYVRAGMTIQFSDDPRTDDYYELLIKRRKRGQIYDLHAFNERLDILLNEGTDPYSTSSLVFSDALFKGAVLEMSVDFSSTRGGSHCYSSDSCYQFFEADTLFAELRHVSEAYYRYKKQFYLYEKTRNLEFIEGTATTISNFSNVNNGRGIVAAYAWSIDSLLVPRDSVMVGSLFR